MRQLNVAGMLLASTAALPAAAIVAEADSAAANAEEIEAAAEAPETEAPAPGGKAITTGVAKGRDLLDSAISASVIDETDLASLSISSIVGIMQNIPGIRSETSDIDGFSQSPSAVYR